MNDELVNFVFSILSGVLANTTYDKIKGILGINTEKRLRKYAVEKNLEKFTNTLEIVLESNSLIEDQLFQLKNGEHTTIEQNHYGSGDNVSGNKEVHYHQHTQNKNQEEALSNGKKLFDSRMYKESQIIFKQILSKNPDNCEVKLFYILATLSGKTIGGIHKEKINHVFSILDTLSNGAYSKLSEYLWLIIYFENIKPRVSSKEMDKISEIKRNKILDHRLTRTERGLLSTLSLASREARFLIM